MDQNILVTCGHALILALDNDGVPPRAAMWVHSTDTDTWKLWIVPHPSITDRHEFYRRVAEIITKNRDTFGDINASDTEMISETHPAMPGLRRLIKAPGIGSITSSGNVVDGYYLPEGIILRVDF